MAVQRVFWVSLGLLTATVYGGSDAAGQCRGRGGGSMPSGSTTSRTSDLPYTANPLASNGYSQNNALALQYQQRVLAAQRQIARLMYQNEQRQRLAMAQREMQAQPYRLARAEAKRQARTDRIAARLRQRQQSSDDYMLTALVDQ